MESSKRQRLSYARCLKESILSACLTPKKGVFCRNRLCEYAERTSSVFQQTGILSSDALTVKNHGKGPLPGSSRAPL